MWLDLSASLLLWSSPPIHCLAPPTHREILHNDRAQISRVTPSAFRVIIMANFRIAVRSSRSFHQRNQITKDFLALLQCCQQHRRFECQIILKIRLEFRNRGHIHLIFWSGLTHSKEDLSLLKNRRHQREHCRRRPTVYTRPSLRRDESKRIGASQPPVNDCLLGCFLEIAGTQRKPPGRRGPQEKQPQKQAAS